MAKNSNENFNDDIRAALALWFKFNTNERARFLLKAVQNKFEENPLESNLIRSYAIGEWVKSNVYLDALGEFYRESLKMNDAGMNIDYKPLFSVRGIIYMLDKKNGPVFMVNRKVSEYAKKPFWEISFKGGIEKDKDYDIELTTTEQGAKVVKSYDNAIHLAAEREAGEEFLYADGRPMGIPKELLIDYRGTFINNISSEPRNSDMMYITREKNGIIFEKKLAAITNVLIEVKEPYYPEKWTEHDATAWVDAKSAGNLLKDGADIGRGKDYLFLKYFMDQDVWKSR